MLMQLEPDARREMGNLLHQQAREQAKHDRHVSVFDLGAVEQIRGARVARGQHGTGGGHHRHPQPFDDG